MTEHLVLDRAATAVLKTGAESGVKTILVHIQNDKSLGNRLETALAIARSCSAHLSCVHITPVEAYVAFDSFGGVFVMNDVIKTIDEEAALIKAEIETKMRSEDVPWDYMEITGNIASQLISRAALADLVVTGRDPHTAEVIKQNNPMIRNDLIMLFGSQQYESISTREGKDKLRAEALATVAAVIDAEGGDGKKVEQLFFTSFVMQ